MGIKEKIQNNGDRATELVLRSQKTMEPVDIFVKSEIQVFGGVLVTCTFRSKKEERLIDSFVFCDGLGDHFFYNPIELTRFLDSKRKSVNANIVSLIGEINTVGGPTAIIAMIVTGTICYLAATNVVVPELLGHALTTILGFYFGSKINDRTKPPASK